MVILQIIERKLHKIKEFEKTGMAKIIKKIKKNLLKNRYGFYGKNVKLSAKDLEYLIFPIQTKHKIYVPKKNPIQILNSNKNKFSLTSIEKKLKFNKNQNTITKHFICYHPSIKNI